MKAREVKMWLRAMPTCREGARYLREVDQVVRFYVPRLAGRDVMLVGEPLEYAFSSDAVAAATRFQEAIRKNHHAVIQGP